MRQAIKLFFVEDTVPQRVRLYDVGAGEYLKENTIIEAYEYFHQLGFKFSYLMGVWYLNDRSN